MRHTLPRIDKRPVALAVLGLILLQSATAQTAKPAAAAASSAESEAQTVVVSGSRIKRDTFSSPAPLQVIKMDDYALSGLTTVSQVLQSVAVTGGSGQINNAYGNYVTDGGPGAKTIGLRGLSPTRTLILINGRRLSPSGTRGSVGAPDLSTLPSAIIDRIEILKDGASSIYGSDAIAGVINLITKRDVSGMTLEGGLSMPVHGGGNQYNLSLTGGYVGEHAHFLAAYSFNEQTPLKLGQRSWTRCNTDYVKKAGGAGNFGDGDFVDPVTGQAKCYPITGTGSNGVTINTIGTSSVAGTPAAGVPSSVTKFNRWRPNSSVTTGVVGYEGVGGTGVSLGVRDTFDPRVLNNSLLSPERDNNLYAQGGIDLPALGDTAEFYWEAMFNRRDSSQTGFRQLSLDYSKGSPLIPSNLAFSTFSGATAITNGNSVGVRAFIGAGNSHSSQTVDFGRAVAGLRGSFARIGWDYDISLTHTESAGTYIVDGFLTNRLAQSLNVVSNGAGGYNCVNPSNGCVAAPALTTAVVGGKLPANWLGFVYNGDIEGQTKYKEDVLTASTTGNLFTLPYGKVKGAFGAELRRNFINDTPSSDMATSNIYNYSSSTQTRGSDQAKDIFGEVEVPLLKNLPFANELTADASIRRADYRSYGAGVTHKFGLLYSPMKWLSLRGTNGTSYRAPALFEQYVGATTGFLSATGDPCNSYEGKGGAVAANCAAEGLPTGFTQTSSIKDVTSGGRSSGLKAENARNNTWGIVLQPDLPAAVGDLKFAFDHSTITVNNGIDRVGVANILSLCYDTPSFASSYCRLVARDPVSKALTVNDSYVNVATNIVSSNEYTVDYSRTVGAGKLRFRADVNQYLLQESKLFADDDWDNVNGNVESPKWSGIFNLNYDIKNWGFGYSTEWVGKSSSYAYLGYDPATSIYKFSTPNYFLHSASVSYTDPVGKWKATIGVRNIADKNPPTISESYYSRVGNAPLYSGYDMYGRSVFASFSKTF